jgi:hypothetical protein
MEKIKDKVLACFYENTFPVILFKLLVAAPEPAYDSVTVP